MFGAGSWHHVSRGFSELFALLRVDPAEMDAKIDALTRRLERCYVCFDDLFSQPIIRSLSDVTKRTRTLQLLRDVALVFISCSASVEQHHLTLQGFKHMRGKALSPCEASARAYCEAVRLNHRPIVDRVQERYRCSQASTYLSSQTVGEWTTRSGKRKIQSSAARVVTKDQISTSALQMYQQEYHGRPGERDEQALGQAWRNLDEMEKMRYQLRADRVNELIAEAETSGDAFSEEIAEDFARNTKKRIVRARAIAAIKAASQDSVWSQVESVSSINFR